MKNLLIYISPTRSFNNPRFDLASNDAAKLVKVQIENSLALGWKKKDIMLVTNFPYQYADTKATVLDNIDFFQRKPQASKINAIIKLFELKMIADNQLYWFHDFDAFQLQPFVENEIQIENNQIALTDYGAGKHFAGEIRWSTGTIFFKSQSRDIFERLQKIFYGKKIDEEEALHLLIKKEPKIKKRVKKINSTYNFIGYGLKTVYEKSTKPLKVVHFHPLTGKKRLGGVGTQSALRFFKGENPINANLLTERLNKIFKFHRIG